MTNHIPSHASLIPDVLLWTQTDSVPACFALGRFKKHMLSRR